MLSREACERRVYRLAVLLSGDRRQATRVISQVLDAQPDLRQLDSAHMDRLTILRSREIPSAWQDRAKAGGRKPEAGSPLLGLPAEIVGGLCRMSPQQREAWILHYVYRMMPRDMARAMDCSVSAIRLHLTSAEGVMSDSIGSTHVAAGKALLEYAMSLDVPEFHRRAVAARKWRRLVVRLIVVLLILAILAAGAWWAYHWITAPELLPQPSDILSPD